MLSTPLLKAKDLNVRRSVRTLLSTVVHCVATEEAGFLSEANAAAPTAAPVAGDDAEGGSDTAAAVAVAAEVDPVACRRWRSLVASFMDVYVDLMPLAADNWPRFAEYWQVSFGVALVCGCTCF